uniref:Uncharacterized protein n=1 Tax=Petromyzon marinus TaxID=7757 RepID=S4R6I6_PETMA
MSSGREPRSADSPSTSSGSSDADQLDAPPPETETPQPKKKEAKISGKTAAKLSTSAKRRIQKELAEITLDPPP